MTSSKSAPAKAESLTWMEQQLNELKAKGSPVYSELLDQLLVIRIADQKARNALIHDKANPQEYIAKLEDRLIAIEFNPAGNPDSEYPYRRKDGSPATLLTTTLLRKFETIQISERLQEAHKRVGDEIKESDARMRLMKQTGLVPTETLVKPYVEPDWASTLPDQIIGDADYKNVMPFEEPAAPVAVDKWSLDSVIKAEIVIRHNLATYTGDKLAAYVKDTLVPLHKEVMTELHARAPATGQTTENDHLFKFMGDVGAHIKTARAALAPNVTSVSAPTTASPFARAVAAATAKAEPAEASPPARSFLQRLSGVGESIGNLITGAAKWLGHATQSAFPKPLRQAAVAAVLGTVVSTSQHAETPPPVTDGAKAVLAVKTAPPRPNAVVTEAPLVKTSFAETAIPTAAKAAVAVAEPEPVRKAAVAVAAPTRTTRADFSAQATTVQPTEVPDELSVTFNGQKLKADVFSVKAACDQIGNDSSICENFVPQTRAPG